MEESADTASLEAADGSSFLDGEIEALRSIYINETEVQKDELSTVVSIDLHPATADNLREQYVKLTLKLTLKEGYPEVIPKINIRNPRGLSDEKLNSLTEDLEKLAESKKGSSMLFEMIEAAKDHLTAENRPCEECAICLYGFHDNDVFIKTECYHYFHSHCLARYSKSSLLRRDDSNETSENIELLCPVCRLPIEFEETDESFPPPVKEDEQFVVTAEILELQKNMSELYLKQVEKGGIIDLEAEKNKYLLEISHIPTASDITSEPNLENEGSISKVEEARILSPTSGEHVKEESDSKSISPSEVIRNDHEKVNRHAKNIDLRKERNKGYRNGKYAEGQRNEEYDDDGHSQYQKEGDLKSDKARKYENYDRERSDRSSNFRQNNWQNSPRRNDRYDSSRYDGDERSNRYGGDRRIARNNSDRRNDRYNYDRRNKYEGDQENDRYDADKRNESYSGRRNVRYDNRRNGRYNAGRRSNNYMGDRNNDWYNGDRRNYRYNSGRSNAGYKRGYSDRRNDSHTRNESYVKEDADDESKGNKSEEDSKRDSDNDDRKNGIPDEKSKNDRSSGDMRIDNHEVSERKDLIDNYGRDSHDRRDVQESVRRNERYNGRNFPKYNEDKRNGEFNVNKRNYRHNEPRKNEQPDYGRRNERFSGERRNRYWKNENRKHFNSQFQDSKESENQNKADSHEGNEQLNKSPDPSQLEENAGSLRNPTNNITDTNSPETNEVSSLTSNSENARERHNYFSGPRNKFSNRNSSNARTEKDGYGKPNYKNNSNYSNSRRFRNPNAFSKPDYQHQKSHSNYQTSERETHDAEKTVNSSQSSAVDEIDDPSASKKGVVKGSSYNEERNYREDRLECEDQFPSNSQNYSRHSYNRNSPRSDRSSQNDFQKYSARTSRDHENKYPPRKYVSDNYQNSVSDQDKNSAETRNDTKPVETDSVEKSVKPVAQLPPKNSDAENSVPTSNFLPSISSLAPPPGFQNPSRKIVYGLAAANPPPGFQRS